MVKFNELSKRKLSHLPYKKLKNNFLYRTKEKKFNHSKNLHLILIIFQLLTTDHIAFS